MKNQKKDQQKKFNLEKFEVLKLKTMTKIVGGQNDTQNKGKDEDTITPPTARI